ncbi:MAG: hypothetical protein AB7K68_15480 [Bacteriovoracia bacterium]
MAAENDVISSRVKDFIHRCIDSVELLRVLLMIQADRNRDWTYEEINNELRSTQDSIRKRVADLVAKKVIAPGAVRDGKVRFIPFSSEIEELVMVLAGHYQLRPYKVIDVIFSRPSSAIQSFADSFRIKKEEE